MNMMLVTRELRRSYGGAAVQSPVVNLLINTFDSSLEKLKSENAGPYSNSSKFHLLMNNGDN